jgi:hypothetical protein
MNSNGDATKDLTTVQDQSVQDRARPSANPEARGGVSLFGFLVQGGGLLAPWWSKQRDLDLDKFWMRSDHLAGAFYTLYSKLSAVPFRIEPRDPAVAAHRRLAEEYQQRLEEESELGQAWQELFTLALLDLWTQDNGMFLEVTGDGPKNGPIVGPATGLLHLDAWRCQRTGDPEYPVVYYDTDGSRYKLHRTRVIFRSQMPSRRAEMLRVGYCWTSRAVNAAQNLIDESVYKQEKMGSRPQRAILLTKGGLDPDTVQSAFRIAESTMSSRGLSRYSKFVVMGDQMMPDAGLEMIDLASLPDGFDYEKDTTLGMFAIALTGAVPPRWLWPATTSGATKADAMYQHVAGLTGGPGATLQMIATAIGGSERGKQHTAGKFLPPTLRMVFDFQDDEQDRASAEIREVRSQARASDIGGKVISVRVARQQMVSDGELSEAQFAELELDDGRLPDGDDVLSLFQSPDPQIMALLIPDPQAATVEDIDAKIEDNWATLQTAPNARLKDKVRQAIAALEALRGKLETAALEAAAEAGAEQETGMEDEEADAEPPEGSEDDGRTEQGAGRNQL